MPEIFVFIDDASLTGSSNFSHIHPVVFIIETQMCNVQHYTLMHFKVCV